MGTYPAAATANDRYLARLRRAERGPHVAALFDFDGTIIAGYSAWELLQERLRRGELPAGDFLETLRVMAQYRMGSIGFSGLLTASARLVRGVEVRRYAQFSEELYEHRIARRVFPETRAIIKAHQDLGHTVAIVSSATVYQIAPTARDLGIDRILCSKYKVARGRFTGDIVRPACFGAGKVLAAESLAATLGLALDRSYFYSDSDDDLGLLERVGHPRAVNPNERLRAIAEARRWPVQQFRSRGTPRLSDYARTLSVTPTLVGAFGAGLGMWLLTRSRREATNFAVGTFGDVAAAVLGIDLQVRGEQNLWAARPCIFVFNHQSKVDVAILAKLARRDLTGVVKRELRDVPIVGKLVELAGAVFIDRKNTPDAIKAMAPLVDAVRRDGKSVCIAPEGSRSLTAKLGPFKKGAFHLAMQSGVPIVPVVIHNSGDVQPKNEFVMRPATVRVDVLAPISTAHWRAATIDRHVRDVRNLFLQRLGQSEPARAARSRVAKNARETRGPRRK